MEHKLDNIDRKIIEMLQATTPRSTRYFSVII